MMDGIGAEGERENLQHWGIGWQVDIRVGNFCLNAALVLA